MKEGAGFPAPSVGSGLPPVSLHRPLHATAGTDHAITGCGDSEVDRNAPLSSISTAPIETDDTAA